MSLQGIQLGFVGMNPHMCEHIFTCCLWFSSSSSFPLCLQAVTLMHRHTPPATQSVYSSSLGAVCVSSILQYRSVNVNDPQWICWSYKSSTCPPVLRVKWCMHVRVCFLSVCKDMRLLKSVTTAICHNWARRSLWRPGLGHCLSPGFSHGFSKAEVLT